MIYTIKSYPTMYQNIRFRSRLEARWAVFLDIIEWYWEYEPYDLYGWVPDFYVKFDCSHSECNGYHDLLAEVKPYRTIEEFEGHPCTQGYFGLWDRPFGPASKEDAELQKVPVDSTACFGINPDVSYWEMTHGAGGGGYDFNAFGSIRGKVWPAWNEAGNIIQKSRVS